MKEIEIKILEIDESEIRKKLASFGAEKIFEGEIEARYLSSENTRKNGETLRVRKVGEKVELCFKGKRENSIFKIKEEIEVITDHFDNTLKIFERLGFKKSSESKKKRESYKLGRTKFEIDTYQGIPTFLEIEAPTEKEVMEAVKKLGYTMKQTTNRSLKQIYDYYKLDYYKLKTKSKKQKWIK